jgi:hypothetical protein
MSDAHNLETLAGALAALSRWLEEEGLEGAVIGGVGASLVGRPRLTRDVDAIVLGDEVGWDALLESAQRYGIGPRIEQPLDFARTTRVLLLRHLPSSIDIDVSLGALPFEREVVHRAATIHAGPIRVRVASPEDLVIMKALARRPRDWSDIEGLLDVHRDIDLDRVRRYLREFSSILELPEIQDDFERMLRNRHDR